jgi:Nucleotide modification associated domain 3
MKIILSRKGFDSSFGGVASPILTLNGKTTMYSLPVPLESSRCGYEDIRWNGENLHSIIASLRTHNRPLNKSDVDKVLGIPNTPHLDPDLVAAARSRKPGWRPLFGQSGGQETQLINEGVHCPPSLSLGDRPLFLFFGWYREVEQSQNGLRFVRGSPDVHAFFGWLQVEQKVSLTDRRDRDAFAHENWWAAEHPHVACDCYDNGPNALYVAPDPTDKKRSRLAIGTHETGLPAAGMFEVFDPDVHKLSWSGECPYDHRKMDNRRTHWKLPRWFYRDGNPSLGMHKNVERWQPLDDRNVHLRSVAKGQEFVFDTKDYRLSDVSNWVETIIRAGFSSSRANKAHA